MSEKEETNRKDSKRKRWILGENSLPVTIVVILVVVISLVFAYIGCNDVVYKRAHDQLDDAVNTVVDQIRSRFRRDREILTATAAILAKSDAFEVDLTPESAEDRDAAVDEFLRLAKEDLETISPIQDFMNLRIYLPSCDVFLPASADGEMQSFKISQMEYDLTVQALDRDRTKEDSEYGSFVSSRVESQRKGMEGTPITGQYVPVVRNDRIVAIICSVTVLKDLPSILRVSNIYNSQADVAIIDIASAADGYEMIMDTALTKDAAGNPTDDYELGNFNEYVFPRIRGWKDADAFREDVVSGHTGDAQIWSDRVGEWLYVRYAPVGASAERWSVMVSVSSSVAFSNVRTVQIIFIVIGSVLAVILLAYFLFIRKNSKDAIARSVEHAVLEEKLHKAEAAERAKTAFLSNMSHDIRTPMNAILGFAALAETNLDNRERVQDYLKKILSSGNHLLSLINDILDMSRIESGKLNIEEKPCRISDIFRDMRNIIQTQMRSKQLDFYMDTLDVVDEDIYCDKLHVNQVILNLLSNAIKFTPAGQSVSLTIRQKAGAPTGYGAYEIRVKDTGIGMSQEFAKHIFEPFERERTSTVSGIQGTGLGMPIAKSIVDAMGGTIELITEKGKGTEFIINLQFRLQTDHTHHDTIRELAGLRALVVDDNFDTCDSVSKMLMRIGMHSEWTMHGREAVLRAQQAMEVGDAFSVFIIDWVMPDLSGFEIVRQIRKIVGEDVPIIIITAYDVSAILDEAKDIGVSAYCNKPIFLSELRDTLISVIDAEKDTSAPETEPQKEEGFRGKKILLTEDNELNREIAMELLTEEGFSVDCAEDGSIAVEKIAAAEPGTYDLVLMDIQMPIMDGYEATKRIRALGDARADVPIVAMTANAFDEDRRLAAECGMNAHVAKPIDIPQLKQVLRKILLGEDEDPSSD